LKKWRWQEAADRQEAAASRSGGTKKQLCQEAAWNVIMEKCWHGEAAAARSGRVKKQHGIAISIIKKQQRQVAAVSRSRMT
jgi:hypothetical protein